MAASNQGAEVPVMQVLEKAHYFTQALVPVPGAVPYPPLTAPSSLRLRTRVVSLTHNNLTYAALGFLVHWWDAHPLPAGGLTPAPYDDPEKYGRVSAWGYAEVLDSTLAGGPQEGDFVFGYLPLATLAQDVEFRVDDEVPGHVLATSAYRARLMPFYNRYFPVARDSAVATQLRAAVQNQSSSSSSSSSSSKSAAFSDDSLGFDALYFALFECGHLVAKFMFDAQNPTHPGMGPDAPAQTPWTREMADLTGATVVLLAPASKTALAMGFAMRKRAAPGSAGPKRVVGAASEASREFVEGTGIYDATVSTTETPDAEFLGKRLGVDVDAGEKVVLIDCGGRAGVGQRWAAAFRKLCQPGRFLLVGIGSEAGEHSPADVLKRLAPKEGGGDGGEKETEAPWFMQVNTGDLRERAAVRVGRGTVFEGTEAAYAAFKEEGVKGFKVRWGEGMEAVKGGWERLAKGETRPEEGMAFLL
ncbi:uncharacterized protein PG986_012536 [Apiospora aurea]|uniref:Uncharacterized protein n=1 Tax=Apiospora aurea TaxID=335848 RepID=A0ABR1Q0B1_9PEZI